jgi:hypothetical protein
MIQIIAGGPQTITPPVFMNTTTSIVMVNQDMKQENMS